MTEVPDTLAAALRPELLTIGLADVAQGLPVTNVETVEIIRTVATKVRFTVCFGDRPERHAFCLKGLLDVGPAFAKGGPTMIREADFYAIVAPRIDVRVPDCVGRVLDRASPKGIIVMRDVIAAGGSFNLADRPLTADYVAGSLEQLAALHAGTALFEAEQWFPRRISGMARTPHLSAPELQALLDGPRGARLPAHVRSAERLFAAMLRLAAHDAARPQYMIHGDCHAGNSFSTAAGPGLIDWQMLQRGGWALDVGYHVSALLSVEDAAACERALLDHYLGAMRGRGMAMPDREDAWLQYRQAVTYGYYLWAITRMVDPALIDISVDRMGQAVARHDSFALVED